MKFMVELVARIRRIIHVFGDENLPDKLSVLRNVRSPFSAARFILCRAQSCDAVVKVMSVLVALKRRIIYVFGDESFSRQVICASEFARTLDGLIWISVGYDDLIICHSASLLWLKFVKRPCVYASGPLVV